jgi:hypothetical protein
VLHHSAAIQVLKLRAYIARGLRLIAQEIEDLATTAIGQGFEN